MDDADVLSLSDIREAIGDAAGLLDQAVEHLSHHRRNAEDSGRMVDLHTIEDYTAQAWALARQAHTRVTEHMAVKDA